jgi:ribosomal protein S18 acetylase RimI-like enzyme
MAADQDPRARHELTAPGAVAKNAIPMAVLNDSAIRCSPISPGSFDACVGILSALQASVAGLRGRGVYRALCRDGLGGDTRLVCLVARSGAEPAGVVLAVVDHVAYWKRFAIRHPLPAARILATRTVQRLATPRKGASANSPPAEHNRTAASWTASWCESGRHIAKIIFIGVLPAFQGRGIARELYLSLFSRLKEIGVRRVDAMIASENLPSLRLHEQAGWRLHRDPPDVFATIPLTTFRNPC